MRKRLSVHDITLLLSTSDTSIRKKKDFIDNSYYIKPFRPSTHIFVIHFILLFPTLGTL